MSTFDPNILRQTMRGYRAVNNITQAERRARLQALSRADGWALFASLYETWQHTGQRAGGDRVALAQRHLEEKHTLRQAFEKLARQKGLL